MKLYLSTAPHIRCRENTRSIMGDVLIAMLPTLGVAVYLFGLRALLLTVISVASAVLAEFVTQKLTHRTIRVGDLSAAVTGMLVALNLPVTAPWWMPIIGSFLAIVLVKEIFGGIGDNFMNPALAARAILLASWPVKMTDFTVPTCFSGIEAVTAATPLAGGEYSLMQLFMGEIPGVIGEVSKAAILLGLAYLLIRKVISWRIPVTLTAAFALVMWIFGGEGAFGGDPLREVLSGGLLFGAVFMATDYTTSPMTAKGQFIYAAGCGLIIAVIRCFGSYAEGVTYGILIMNVVTPLIDKYVKAPIYGVAKEKKVKKTSEKEVQA